MYILLIRIYDCIEVYKYIRSFWRYNDVEHNQDLIRFQNSYFFLSY